MAEQQPTPEEQLLKLIENPRAKPEGGKPSPKVTSGKPSPAVSTKKPFSLPSFEKLRGVLSFLKQEKAAKKQEQGGGAPAFSFDLNIKWVNHLLLALVLAALLYLVLDLFVLKSDQRAFLGQVSTSDAVYPVTPTDALSGKHDLTYYQKPLQSRNPFLPPSFEPASTGDAASVAGPVGIPTSQIQSMIEGLKLVGISTGADGPIAMIEEAETGRTFFVKRGQEISGLKIQKISREKVTVTYEGKEADLF